MVTRNRVQYTSIPSLFFATMFSPWGFFISSGPSSLFPKSTGGEEYILSCCSSVSGDGGSKTTHAEDFGATSSSPRRSLLWWNNFYRKVG